MTHCLWVKHVTHQQVCEFSTQLTWFLHVFILPVVCLITLPTITLSCTNFWSAITLE